MTNARRNSYVEWAAGIRPERQVWMWDNRIPVGTAAALAGRGGTGKTTYALHLAAQLSQGTLPGEFFGDPRPTLMWSGEDAWGPVLVPRLMAAGADLGMVGRLAITSAEIDAEVTPALPVDVEPIRTVIRDTGAALVIIDPIASTMTGDLHREADVRAALDSLARVASDTGAVVMFVRHFGKGGGNASDKMSGSHAFRDAVRSVFLFAEDGDTVIVTQDKGNYAPKGNESFAYRLDSVTVPTDDGPTSVARIVELGASEVSVGDVINRDPAIAADAHDVDSWLTDLLANGPVAATEVFSSADAAGYSKDQAKRAKKRLSIEAMKIANAAGAAKWLWRFPTKGADTQGCPTDSRSLAPLLPSSSEGVQQGAEHPREQRSASAPLPIGESSSVAPDADSPTPLSVRRAATSKLRTFRFRGEEVPRCYVCSKPVVGGQGDAHLSCVSKQSDTA